MNLMHTLGRWLGGLVLFLLLVGLAAFSFLVVGSFATDMVTALGAMAGTFALLAGLTFSYAQSLENAVQRRHINREAKHMFFGTVMLFLAVFFQFVLGSSIKAAPALATALNALSIVAVGLFMLLGFFMTVASLWYVLGHLGKAPDELEKDEQARTEARARGVRRNWVDRMLER